jgi:hypothetical protein
MSCRYSFGGLIDRHANVHCMYGLLVKISLPLHDMCQSITVVIVTLAKYRERYK